MNQVLAPPRFQLSFDQREAYQVGEQYLTTNEYHPPYAIIGSAGTGKSYVCSLLIEAAFDTGVNILMVAPTGYLTDALRCQWEDRDRITVGTFDSQFRYDRYNAEDSTGHDTHALLNYGMVFLDEFGYLGKRRFDHLINCWKAIDGVCKLIMAGVFSQLEPPDNSGSCETHCAWHDLRIVVKSLKTQHRIRPEQKQLLSVARHVRDNGINNSMLRSIIGSRSLSVDGNPDYTALARWLRDHPTGI